MRSDTCEGLKRFVGDCRNFERNSLTNGKPMYVFESRGDVMVTSNSRYDDTGQSILNFLEPIKENSRKIEI